MSETVSPSGDELGKLARRFLDSVREVETEWGEDYTAMVLKEINVSQLFFLEVRERARPSFSPLVKVLEGLKNQVEDRLFALCDENRPDEAVSLARAVFAEALKLREIAAR